MKRSFFSIRMDEELMIVRDRMNLDYEAGEQEVGGGADVDVGSISVLSLILQPGEHHHPPPPALHHVHHPLRRPLVAAD